MNNTSNMAAPDMIYVGNGGYAEIPLWFSNTKYGADFVLTNAEPDNIRRQNQDYSDWANAHDKGPKT